MDVPAVEPPGCNFSGILYKNAAFGKKFAPFMNKAGLMHKFEFTP